MLLTHGLDSTVSNGVNGTKASEAVRKPSASSALSVPMTTTGTCTCFSSSGTAVPSKVLWGAPCKRCLLACWSPLRMCDDRLATRVTTRWPADLLHSKPKKSSLYVPVSQGMEAAIFVTRGKILQPRPASAATPALKDDKLTLPHHTNVSRGGRRAFIGGGDANGVVRNFASDYDARHSEVVESPAQWEEKHGLNAAGGHELRQNTGVALAEPYNVKSLTYDVHIFKGAMCVSSVYTFDFPTYGRAPPSFFAKMRGTQHTAAPASRSRRSRKKDQILPGDTETSGLKVIKQQPHGTLLTALEALRAAPRDAVELPAHAQQRHVAFEFYLTFLMMEARNLDGIPAGPVAKGMSAAFPGETKC
ncbi:hypothetical protein CGC20_15230 [Leishmania donovani]|uniref:Uncharacterized protein n=1 Tax=Leishmania donovani TaxID=5661 RepID=A0A504XG20_LEIDO|nr:hypothetical protein CGC20_15230 [Leishmania donovani]